MEVSILENRIKELRAQASQIWINQKGIIYPELIKVERIIVRLTGWHKQINGVEPNPGLTLGYWPGDICCRETSGGYCTGIIGDLEREGGCSCHMGNPPCGYCTAGSSQCVACGWEMESV